MVMEIPYSEICALHNGNQIKIYPLEFRPTLGEMIEEETNAFWNRVMPAQKVWREYLEGKVTYEWAETIIQKYEPEADASDKTQELLSERWKKVYDEAVANDKDEEVVVELREVKAKIKELEAKKDLAENYFRQRFANEKVEKLLTGSGEFIKASKRANASKLTITI
jgi:predicted DNA-binding WGR domain protein